MRMRNMHRARLHVRIKKHKRGHLLSVSLIDKFSLMPRTIEQHLENLDQIRSQPNHNISVRGSMARANILQREVTFCKKTFLRVVEYFIFSAYSEKEGGDVVPDQHLHRLHHRQLPHCENHSKRLGDCPQVRSLFLVSSFLKNYESPVENVLRPGQIFFSLTIKKIFSLLLQKCTDSQQVGNLLLAIMQNTQAWEV